MSALTTADALRAAYEAGFRGDQLLTAVAVARAESGLRPDAVGDGGASIGLWQVHLPSHPTYRAATLTDPVEAARAAFAISGGGENWRPWTVYKTGAYRQHLPVVAEQAQALGFVGSGTISPEAIRTGIAIPGITGPGPSLDDLPIVGDAVGGVVNWLNDQLLSVLVSTVFTAGALGLIALGFMRLTGARPSDVLGAAGKATGVAGLATAAT